MGKWKYEEAKEGVVSMTINSPTQFAVKYFITSMDFLKYIANRKWIFLRLLSHIETLWTFKSTIIQRRKHCRV